MDERPGTVIGLKQYLSNVMKKPSANIRSGNYIPWLTNSILLIVFVLMVTGLAVVIRLYMFPEPENQYMEGIFLVELLFLAILAYFCILILPALFANILFIFLLTRKSDQSPPSFQKVFSDHTNIFIYSYILFIIGTLWLSLGLVTIIDQFFYITIIAYIAAVIIYAGGSAFMAASYVIGPSRRNLILMYTAVFIIVFPMMIYLIISSFRLLIT